MGGGTNKAEGRVLMLLLALCVILVCQKARLGFLNVRSVRTLAGFNITESIRIPSALV